MVKTWKNWAGTTICKPKEICCPTTTEELIQLVKHCNDKKVQFKVVGHGDSYNSNFHTKGVLISLKHLNRVLDINTAEKLIKVEAGMPIISLVGVAKRHGLSFSSLGTNMFDNIAGACSAGHHGSGINYGILSSYLDSFELLTPSGNVLLIKKGEPLYDALGVNLGAAGIIITLTFNLEIRFKLKQDVFPISLKQFESQFDILCKNNDHVKLIWAPHTEQYQCWVANRTDVPCDSNLLHWKTNTVDGLGINNLVHAVGLYAAGFYQPFIKSINSILANYFLKPSGTRVGWAEQIFYLPHLLKQDAVEYAVPITRTVEFLDDLKKLINRKNYYVQFPIEVRFVQQDNFWISPAYQKDMCYVGTKSHLLPGQKIHYQSYFKDVSALVELYEGRPHWGKQLYSEPNYYETVFPKWKEFWTLIRILDKERLCSNEWLDSMSYSPTEKEIKTLKQTLKL